MTEERQDIIRSSRPEDIAAAKPAWLRERLEWLMDQRLGLILHWGPYCQWDCYESWGLVPADAWARPEGTKCWEERGRDLERFQKDYWALNRTFNPARFDPDAWAAAAADAGIKYVAFTTKHHDGFCMFDTRTTDYRVTSPDCPFSADPRANITRHVFDAFRNRGMGISCYFSKSDWHCPWYWSRDFAFRDRNPNYNTHERPDLWNQFVRFVHAQVEELMTGYGPIDVLWLDGGQVRPPHQDIDMAGLAAMARRHQPGLIVADRTVGGDYEDLITPEQQVPDAPLGLPWESCVTIGKHWKYYPGDVFKPVGDLVRMLADVAAKGGNLLLGIGPTPAGEFEPAALDRLRGLGEWMRVNGEAIYGTRAVAPYVEGNVRYTRKGDSVHAIVLAPEGQDRPAGTVRLRGIVPRADSRVTLLGAPAPLAWRMADGAMEFTLPERLPTQHAAVVRFTV